MKYNRFGYLIGEGFSNVFKNKKSTGASLMIMCATMIIFGIFLILGENINQFVDQVKSEQGFQVFLKVDATDDEIQKIGEKIRKVDGVSTIEFKDKNYALNTMKEKFGDKADLIDAYGPEYYPTSYIVTLTDLNKNKEVQEEISKIDGVNRITSSDETVSKLLNIAKGIRTVTGVILALLIIISIFIISNTIKLTVIARRKEISIMKYVGATNSFIRWPFIVEGIIIGIMASIISIVIVGIAYDLLARQIVDSGFLANINLSLVSFKDMISLTILVYLLLGTGIGALGSTISMRKYLKV